MKGFPLGRPQLTMKPRALRIRHYVGTIVATCSLGGLLLAFELAFLFQSVEQRQVALREDSGTLTAATELRRDVADWLRAARASLGDEAGAKTVEEALEPLQVRLVKLGEAPECAGSAADIEFLAERLRLGEEGLRISLKLDPSTAFSTQRVIELGPLFEGLEGQVSERLHDIEARLQQQLRVSGSDLDASREQLWRTVGLSAAGYALLVLLVWRWVASRMIRPLQALTRESRRTLNDETAFRLEPDGPHEVRLLTESLSTLVGNLVGARSHLEEKVKERTAELERANRAKNEFLANMSHEIRTPMTAILGYAELCLALDIPETDRRRYAQIIHDNGEHLLSVINDILDVSKIEAGRMTVEPTPCSPFEVVSEVRALMELRAREKGLQLKVENVGAIPEIVRTDPTRLRQILLNLLNNAIKFTEQGEVVLSFGMQPLENGGERLRFEVRDTGVGLTPEQMERVFRPFVQADTSTTRKYGGSGLGLTISQTLARLLGGDLTCESEAGKGSCFRITLDPGPLEGVRRLQQFPADASREPRAIAPVTGPGPGPALRGRVLLAEDVAVNRRLISTILLRAGIHVEEAENGRIALEKTLAARDAGQPFDIVFMDMQMPEMDGYEATRQLRQAGYLRPIIALTSHSMSNERQRCLEAGCDEFMTKPIDRLVLVQVLSRFLSSDEPEQHQAA
ncbi:MAG: response regulator [Planctomycetes bacterium]|nr:response regulator [Planctomycetota bacterium]